MNLHDIEAAARRKLEAEQNARVQAVRDYAENARVVGEARETLREAESQHLAAYRAAVRVGWTDADLKGFGIESPSKSVGGRPKKARSARPAETQEDTGSGE
ncbi:hypothetical protein [Arthrobacter bambusae]|uniref:hypothetical protein n=1 Tax=Arthrobacter bambusae TaxID=1338426 RepID=UPI00278AD287|nr:hypothetical protein [Arthrobacter bambusae]MDQ0241396.1 hypothetical protein [Arthrobacter bambusae]